eukprot:COSAG02_NODE_6168_length_3753_cov_45.738318_1_plen_35_part_10
MMIHQKMIDSEDFTSNENSARVPDSLNREFWSLDS